jgi:ribosome biogenesis SPOUT family RNA methylase Rps3
MCQNVSLTSSSVKDLGFKLEKICLLDSESPMLLTPDDASIFTHFLFGGILGNTDEFDFDRTKILRNMGFPTRNLGSIQMTTDTAIKTTHLIINRGTPFSELNFIDRPTIKASLHESLILNFRFFADDQGNPQIAKGITDLLLMENEEQFNVEMLE